MGAVPARQGNGRRPRSTGPPAGVKGEGPQPHLVAPAPANAALARWSFRYCLRIRTNEALSPLSAALMADETSAMSERITASACTPAADGLGIFLRTASSWLSSVRALTANL